LVLLTNNLLCWIVLLAFQFFLIFIWLLLSIFITASFVTLDFDFILKFIITFSLTYRFLFYSHFLLSFFIPMIEITFISDLLFIFYDLYPPFLTFVDLSCIFFNDSIYLFHFFSITRITWFFIRVILRITLFIYSIVCSPLKISIFTYFFVLLVLRAPIIFDS
jgi:hypothetical protein